MVWHGGGGRLIKDPGLDFRPFVARADLFNWSWSTADLSAAHLVDSDAELSGDKGLFVPIMRVPLHNLTAPL